ncbi:MAG: GNAT family N-acetyltransferase [Rhodothermales bacterium]|nr:GNAT family N-acetyltransferase [Rhodothermales bacterium]
MTDHDQTIRIRPAYVSEADALTELAVRSKTHWGYSNDFIDACRDELTISEEQISADQSAFFVLEVHATCVGYYGLFVQEAPSCELDSLFIDPRSIGNGYGRLLLNHAKLQALRCGATRLVVQSDPNAQSFYEKEGFILCGSRESSSIPGRSLPLLEVSL